jgi:hypothetical protein
MPPPLHRAVEEVELLFPGQPQATAKAALDLAHHEDRRLTALEGELGPDSRAVLF